MNTLKKAALLSVAMLTMGFASAQAPAAALDEKTIPASAKWVIHVDVQALTKTQTWAQLEPRLMARPQYAKSKGEVERIFRITLPQDLHDFTLFGASANPQDGVAIIRGKIDQKDLMGFLSRLTPVKEETLDGHAVFSWDDNGRSRTGSFIGNDRLIIAESTQNVVDALNVLSGKGERIASSALLAGAQKKLPSAGVLIYLAGDQLATLAAQAGTKSPLIRQLDSAWVSLNADDKGFTVFSEVTAQKEQAAADVVKAIEGARAWLGLADESNTTALALAEALQPMTTKVEGVKATITWPISDETVSKLLDMLPAEK